MLRSAMSLPPIFEGASTIDAARRRIDHHGHMSDTDAMQFSLSIVSFAALFAIADCVARFKAASWKRGLLVAVASAVVGLIALLGLLWREHRTPITLPAHATIFSGAG